MKNTALLDKLTAVRPSPVQLKMLEMGYYTFLHFGMNTFTKKEWGSGKNPPSDFKLESFDADKLVSDIKSTGSAGIIFTAKHHDGFCLFNSKYTDYTVAHSPYKNGKGDILKELSVACQQQNMPLGVYLSPWDRHEKSYGTPDYNDFYCNQLEEICSGYGKLFCIWLDGAVGAEAKGKQVYDWERIYSVVHRLQPDCCISNCGKDVRWIGNENGKCRKAEWSVVSTQLYPTYTGEKIFKATDEDLGSREKLESEEVCYYPAEMDVPITKNKWFYTFKNELLYTRSAKNLAQCYFDSVGNNALLLLNIAPDKKLSIRKKFLKRLYKARKIVLKKFARPVTFDINKINENTFKIKASSTVKTMIMAEDLTYSQRIESFKVESDEGIIYDGLTVGYKKYCFFNRAASSFTVTIKSRYDSKIAYIKLFE